MNQMKKLTALLLALAMVFSLAACGGSSEGNTASGSEAAEGESAAAEGESAAPAESTGAAIKLGGIGPTSGAAAIYGQATQHGAEIAVA
jgi:branched-chain amino acid transport system substrate-binding protein